MIPIRAVIFDLDGVLVDATEWHYDALNRALKLFGYSIPRYDHLTTYNGLPTKAKLERLTVEKGLPRGLHPMIWMLKQKFTTQEILTKCVPAFEQELMIRRLKRDGYKLAVCSNAIRATVDMMLMASGLEGSFDLVLSNEDVRQNKPHPMIYLEAFKLLDVRPDEVVIVEDSDPGIESARSAGGHVCEVSGFQDVGYDKLKSFIGSIQELAYTTG